MIQTGTLLKGILSSILSLHLALGSAAPTITINTADNRAYVHQVSAQLPWSTSLRKGANAQIRSQIRTLETLLNQYRAAGATKVSIQPVYESLNAIDKIALDGLTRFKLVAVDASGAVVRESAAYPQDIKDYANYLVSPQTRSCSLEGWSLFTPETWFAVPCKFKTPTANEYLKYSLRAHLNYAEAQDIWNFTINALQFLSANNVPYEVQGGNLKADLSKFSAGLTALPLSKVLPLGGYQILVDSANHKLTFVEMPPELNRLAREGKYNSQYQMLSY